MTKKEELLNLLSGKVLFSLLLGIIFLIIGILFSNIFLIFFYIIIFNIFDYLGYSKLLNSGTSPNVEAYRIMQTMMQVMILAFIYSVAGFWVTTCSEIIHLTGGQDLLYYWIGNYKLDAEWTWMYWTPVGWFWNKSKPIKLKIIIIQAIIGLVISILIYFMVIK